MDKRDIGLPVKEFMYTLDQIAFLLDTKEHYIRQYYIHFEGRSVGTCPRDRLLAVNIAPEDAPGPEWRVAEKHLKRWMRFKGWKIYERGYVK